MQRNGDRRPPRPSLTQTILIGSIAMAVCSPLRADHVSFQNVRLNGISLETASGFTDPSIVIVAGQFFSVSAEIFGGSDTFIFTFASTGGTLSAPSTGGTSYPGGYTQGSPFTFTLNRTFGTAGIFDGNVTADVQFSTPDYTIPGTATKVNSRTFPFLVQVLATHPTWTGTAGDGLWQTPGNWNGSFVPISTLNALFDQAGTYTVSLAGPAEAGHMIVSNGSVTLGLGSNTLNLSQSLQVDGISGATLVLDGNSIGGAVSSPGVYVGGSAGSSGGEGTLRITNGAVANVSGTARVWNSSSRIELAGGALNVGILDLNGDASALDWTGGTLRINQLAPALDGPLVVPSGGTLGGVGTIARETTVNSGGKIAPGNSTGITTFSADLTLSLGSEVVLEIGAPVAGSGHDQIVMTNASTLNINNAQLKLIAIPGIVTGVSYTIVNASAGVVTGNFQYLSNVLLQGGPHTQGNLEYSINYTGNSVQVTFSMVPEPTALPLLAGLLLLRRNSSRRRNGRRTLHRR